MTAERIRAASKALRAAVGWVHASSPYVGNSVDDACARLQSLGFGTCPVAEAVADWLDRTAETIASGTWPIGGSKALAVADRILSGGEPG